MRTHRILQLAVTDVQPRDYVCTLHMCVYVPKISGHSRNMCSVTTHSTKWLVHMKKPYALYIAHVVDRTS